MVINLKNKSKVKPDSDLTLSALLDAPAPEVLVLSDIEIIEMVKHVANKHDDHRVVLTNAPADYFTEFMHRQVQQKNPVGSGAALCP